MQHLPAQESNGPSHAPLAHCRVLRGRRRPRAQRRKQGRALIESDSQIDPDIGLQTTALTLVASASASAVLTGLTAWHP
jgi:hypothetical protein